MKITNAKGLKLDALLVTPQPMHAGVVLCHGFLSEKDNETHAAIMKKLASYGIGSLAFDFTGHGKSEGRVLDANLADFYADVACVVTYGRPLFPGRLGLYGASLGGAMSILYATYNRVDALALKCPVIDPVKSWDNYLRNKITIVPEQQRAGLSVRVKEQVAGTPPLYKMVASLSCPAMIIGAAYDDLVDIDDLTHFASVLSISDYTILNADHDFSQREEHDKLTDLVSSWFAKRLKVLTL